MNAPKMGSFSAGGPEHEKVLNLFEDAWQTGTPPRLEAFCPPAASAGNDPARLVLLRELFKIDLEYRWKHAAAGHRVKIEQYGERYPELAACAPLWLELIGEEYRVRHRWGDRPQQAEYLNRFGKHRAQLPGLLRRIDAELAAEIVREGRPPEPGFEGGKPMAIAPVPSVPSFLDSLRQYRLLSPEQMKNPRLTHSPDPRALARQLIEQGWLTAYQVNQLFQGRGAGLVVGPYLLLERLGEGGGGLVFKARHQHMNRIVALKLIRKELLTDPEIVGRFQREVHALSKLTHPHVVHAYDAGPAGGNFFLAMEYIEGIDLARLVKQKHPLAVAQACDYIWQTALGLQHLHEHGLVHRDIKPSNLLVAGLGAAAHAPSSSGVQPAPWGVVKILDLGLARLHRPIDEATAGLTGNNALMMGTLDYMAPEQALDFHQVDIRADIYSLGGTFYYLLTGRPPFPDCTLAQKLHRHQNEDPIPVEQLRKDVPAGLAPVLHKMMAKRPADRFQTPGEIAQLLGAIPPAPPGRGTLVPVAPVATLLPATMRYPSPAPRAIPLVPASGGGWRQSLQPLRRILISPLHRLPTNRRRRLVLAGIAGTVLLAGLLVWLFSGPSLPSGEPVSPAFLADMQPINILGKLGKKGKDLNGERLVVSGALSPNALAMQPAENGRAVASYRIGKRYNAFKASVSTSEKGFTFRVMGDGNQLFQLSAIDSPADRKGVVVPVAGIDVLELVVNGPPNGCFTVWNDARVENIAVDGKYYLSDMPEVKAIGNEFRKDARVAVNGQAVGKGLNFDRPNVVSQVIYRLGKQYKRFRTDVGLDDQTGTAGGPPHLIFSVRADGKLLWESKPLEKAGSVQKCDVSVEGVDQIELIIACSGNSYWWRHGVWMDPYVSK